jgi:PAS domain S-box-containing protein
VHFPENALQAVSVALGFVAAMASGNAEEKLRRRAESDRLASEAKLRSYFESASEAIIAVSAGGHIVLVNRRTEEMFGYARDELLGQKLEILLPDRYRTAYADHRADYFAEPHVRAMGAGMDLAGRRRDGTEFPVEIGLSFVEDEAGLLAFGLVTDITERKRATDQLARINAELRRSNAELEQFAYVASHDLQEPLRMITSYLHLLERRYSAQLDADAQEFVHFAVDGANRMKVLIRDLLTISRAGTQTVRCIDVPGDAILQGVLIDMKATIEEHGAVITSDPLPTILVDPGLMARVFQNLIGNAIKFHKENQPRVHVSAQLKGTGYVFSVRDNGIGIDPKHADRIFQIFQRLHGAEAYPGTGIGLAISKKIIERHGGSIWLESAPGKGSTFYFSIPSKADASRELQQAAST